MKIFNVLKAVFVDIKNYFWPWSNRRKLIRAVVFLAVIGGIIFFISRSATPDTIENPKVLPIVYVGTISDMGRESGVSFVGEVRSVSEAAIQAEASGRVTRVNVKAGENVSAGTILVTLENSSQQASVLQTQGAYEGALASAAQSNVSVSDAQNNRDASINTFIATYRSAYTSVSSVVFTTIDQFYGNPDNFLPGVRVDTKGQTDFLNTSRIKLQSSLPTWQSDSNSFTNSSDYNLALSQARTITTDVIAILDVLIETTSQAKGNDQLNGQPLSSYTASLIGARTALNSTLSSLNSAESGIKNAEEALARAKLGGTTGDVSAANAQVKQALGALRSAQANLSKTILRAPISGVVNNININVGDYVSAFTKVAEVANNGELEVTIYVTEADAISLTPGDRVKINNTETGSITNIAPAIDPSTLKIPVKIISDTNNLTNGSTVTVSLDAKNENEVSENLPLFVPITAVKFTADSGSYFTVEDGRLVSNSISIDEIFGSYVAVTNGMTQATEFVIDARGLIAGEEVEAVEKN